MGQVEFYDHLAQGITHFCRAWAITRHDGVVMGFSDHDVDFSFDSIIFRAHSGLKGSAVQQGSGLSVDNSQIIGALTADSITETDIAAGRYDGAKVHMWLVNWGDVSQRSLLFYGTLGDITRSGGQFEAELRALSDALNRPVGRVYQPGCDAALGDGACKINLGDARYHTRQTVAALAAGHKIRLGPLPAFAPAWFVHGAVRVETGAAMGLEAMIKSDTATQAGERVIGLWQPLGADLAVGDRILLTAGCDKRAQTCQDKFRNLWNFRGFPHIPGEDWLTAFPAASRAKDGGRLKT